MSFPQIPVASHWFNRFLRAGPMKISSVEGSIGDAFGSEVSFSIMIFAFPSAI
jgi:hypothetical protein